MADLPTTRPAVPVRRTRASRFSVLLERTVDYTAYGPTFLQHLPRFDSLRDAETELASVLHDAAFLQPPTGLADSIAAENVALAVDWFVGALSQLFDNAEPFQNPGFLQLCCMFFAAPLYEHNARLVQRHLVKRAYSELNVSTATYDASLWLLLALLHLATEFQPDTYVLCKDSGLFPLLQRLVVRGAERNLHVLAMSLMFEIAQAVALAPADVACVTDDTLLYLLDYIERMRYAESDVYNNTGTKLVLALNEQFLRLAAHAPPPPVTASASSGGGREGRRERQMRQHRLLVDKLEGSGALAPHAPSALEDTVCASPQVSAMRAMHVRTSSVSGSPTDTADLAHAELMQPMHALLLDARALPRSRSMDFRLPPQNPSAEDTQAMHRPQSSSGSSGSARTPVISILASRIDCCKTFTENLVFLLNRETDPATQILILHMLENILSDRQTCGIMYTNDMHVLIDVVLRALGDLAEGAQMVCQAYVGVLRALLCNPAYLKDRHRLSDVELCLVSLLRQSLVCAQPEEGPVERRAGAASPASSMSSAMSDETCCARVSEESPVVLPKTSRRPPPPPPRVKTVHTDSDRPTAPAHRRRPAPPPPPMRLPAATAHCSTDDSSCSNGGGSFARPPRRKAPPPPPPSPRTAPPTPSQKPRPRAPEQTGLRRQLSVKKSVSKYKRDSLRLPPPLPPPRQRASRPVTPVSPVVEVAAEAEAEADAGDTPDGAQDAWSLRAALEDSVEGRRATRKLVESALRCCHEARNMAVVRSPRSGVF